MRSRHMDTAWHEKQAISAMFKTVVVSFSYHTQFEAIVVRFSYHTIFKAVVINFSYHTQFDFSAFSDIMFCLTN
jgi:hypothetical protein